jgi:3-deoxy-D-manno-octulosonate 8-phosphate phosphatase (KDO 8-P phosphatase)
MTGTLRNKIKKIKWLVLDVDGVLTNGAIMLDEHGKEIKAFDVHDGYGIVLLQEAGYKTALLSARSAKAVTARAKDLRITKVYQNASPKIKAYHRLLSEMKLKDEQVCFIGDDLPDIAVLKRVGLSVSVPNAADEVKRIADYVTKREGGRGAVREVVEMILKTNRKWAGLVKAAVLR